MYANYVIDESSVYEIDEECVAENNRCLEKSEKRKLDQDAQVTFSAYI